MAKSTKLMFAFLLITLIYKAQSDTLNKFNAKGKKQGYWKVYFDANILETDSSNSFFYGLQLYDNGSKVLTFLKIKEKKKLKMRSDVSLPEKGKPIILSGTFNWCIDSVLKYEETYNNGLPLKYKRFSQRSTDKTYVLSEVADFTKKYNNIPGTFFDTVYSLYYSDRTIVFCYRKGKKRWRSYRVKGGYVM